MPEVFAWSSDVSNPVGAEYIIMEKAPGVQLFKVWDTISDRAKLTVVEKLTKLEKELASIQFPALGSLYLSESHTPGLKQAALPAIIDASGSYFVGPSCDRSWLLDRDADVIENELSSGPCKEIFNFRNSCTG